MSSKNYVGGQAVIEGVMMKNKSCMAIAVRDETGSIRTHVENKESSLFSKPFFKIPFIRGVVNFVYMMAIGIRSLSISANLAMDDDSSKEKIDWYHIAFSMVVALGFSLLLFKFTPLFITQTVHSSYAFSNSFWFALFEGAIKVTMLILYIFLIGLIPDIRRTFQYHGAEHKTVNCYEQGKKLTLANVKKQSIIHVRCGTSFIVFVILISILAYSLIPKDLSLLEKFGIRILFLPVIASISYELLRLSAEHYDKWFMRVVMQPGLWVQRLTTREPDDKQLEVAITSMNMALNEKV